MWTGHDGSSSLLYEGDGAARWRLPRPQGALGAVNSFRDLFSAVIGVGMVGEG